MTGGGKLILLRHFYKYTKDHIVLYPVIIIKRMYV